ncbi:unnamed protein product [Calicophoron daubneyi]|uniref:Uncharacterized protein n=1 Tax=Calicophoron daubneyi TaxID=300641 RepID=A0AAV2TAH1_CALDB
MDVSTPANDDVESNKEKPTTGPVPIHVHQGSSSAENNVPEQNDEEESSRSNFERPTAMNSTYSASTQEVDPQNPMSYSESSSATVTANYLEEPTVKSESKTEHLQRQGKQEYARGRSGVVKVVHSSKESRHMSRTTKTTHQGDSTDSTSANISEFIDFPKNRPGIPSFGRSGAQGLPRTPIVSTEQMSDSGSRSYVVPVVDVRSQSKPHSLTVKLRNRDEDLPLNLDFPSENVVPLQVHEDMKRSYEAEIASLKGLKAGEPQSEDQESTESLRRRIIALESDLKSARSSVSKLTDERRSVRKQCESWMSKAADLENSNRMLQDKAREFRSMNRKMVRDLEDRESTVDKLREAYGREKRLLKILNKTGEEYNMLARDYEILRQSYNRKEQQLYGYSSEKAELLRRLDAAEYERSQTEHELRELKRRIKNGKYRGGSLSHRRGNTYSDLSTSSKRHSTMPYGQYTSDFQTIFSKRVEETELGAESPSVGTAEPKYIRNGDDTLNTPDWQQESYVNTAEGEGEMSPDIERVQSSKQSATPLIASGRVRSETFKNIKPNSMSEDQRGAGAKDDQYENKPDGLSSSPAPSPERTTGDENSPERPRVQSKVTRKEFFDAPNGTEGGDRRYRAQVSVNVGGGSYDEDLVRGPRSSLFRRSRESFSPRLSPDYLRTSPSRSPRRRRPASAYDFTSPRYSSRDYEIYPSPLPQRSTTSFAKLHSYDMSPDREYSMLTRSPSRKQRAKGKYVLYSPDPLRYESGSVSHGNIQQLQEKIDYLQREKRMLENDYFGMQLSRASGVSSRTHEEMSGTLKRLNSEIQRNKARLSSARAWK